MVEMVEVKEGICTGRNGTFDIKGVSLMSFDDSVLIDAISKRNGIRLNAGLTIDRAAAKKLGKYLLSL